jgi:hypothetical protein
MTSAKSRVVRWLREVWRLGYTLRERTATVLIEEKIHD